MAKDQWIGARVRSDGRAGRVIDTRSGGFETQVQFDDRSRPSWVRTDRLEIIAEQNEKKGAPPTTHNERALPSASTPLDVVQEPAMTARRVIEALRLGIVADDGVNLFTVGRNEELAELRKWLANDNEGSKALIGNYGTGKTHLMRYLLHEAVRDGWVVAQVSVNPAESPFRKPKSVYAEAVRTLKWHNNGSECGFKELLQAAIRLNLHSKHRYFRSLKVDSPEELWAWIEARSAPSRPVWGYSSYAYYPGTESLHTNMKTANIYTYLLSSIASIAAHPNLGCRGLLVAFDEAESIDTRQTPTEFERGINFVNALIATSEGNPALTKAGGNFKGNYRLDPSKLSSDIPFLYAMPSRLKVLFALTEEDTLRRSMWLQTVQHVQVRPLGHEERYDLRKKITDLYLAGYQMGPEEIDWSKPLPTIAKMNDLTRYFVKGAVEILDLSRIAR